MRLDIRDLRDYTLRAVPAVRLTLILGPGDASHPSRPGAKLNNTPDATTRLNRTTELVYFHRSGAPGFFLFGSNLLSRTGKA